MGCTLSSTAAVAAGSAAAVAASVEKTRRTTTSTTTTSTTTTSIPALFRTTTEHSNSCTNHHPAIDERIEDKPATSPGCRRRVVAKQLKFAPAVSGILRTTVSSSDDNDDDYWTIRYSCLSHKGHDPEDDNTTTRATTAVKPNQDAFGVVENFLTVVPNTNDSVNNNNSDSDHQQPGDGGCSVFFGVYDGHGVFGQECAQFAKENLPRLIQEQIRQQIQLYPSSTTTNIDSNTTTKAASTTTRSHQQQQQQMLLHTSLEKAHLQCNQELHDCDAINDANSGTTSISVWIDVTNNNNTTGSNGNGNNNRLLRAASPRITVCNVGDSRAILGTTTTQRSRPSPIATANGRHDNDNPADWHTVSLSIDQTPRRSDEAARCVQAGARILTCGELKRLKKKQKHRNGSKDSDDSDYDDSTDDNVEDPPRVWARDGTYPGTAFTRSLGDAVAETLGVCAQPEILLLPPLLQENTSCRTILVLATDGVFDVLSNQQVMDICLAHYNNNNSDENGSSNDNNDDTSSSPAVAATTRACQAVLQASYEEWLRNDDDDNDNDEALESYDDMTIICIFIHHGKDDENGRHDINRKNNQTTRTTTIPVAISTRRSDEMPPQWQPRPSKRIRQKTLHCFSSSGDDDDDQLS